MFKSILCNESNRYLLKDLIEYAIEIKVTMKELMVPELTKDNIIVKGKVLYVLVIL